MDSSNLPSLFDSLAEDEREKKDFERLWRLIEASDAERAASYDVDEEWNELADRLDLESEARTRSEVGQSADARSRRMGDREARSSGASPMARLQQWTRMFTVAILLIGVVGGGVWWWSRPVSVATSAGQRTVATLPDGSTAELNGATTVRYARGFGALPWAESSVRTVYLNGEAYFDVVDDERPFRVRTPNAEVEVLGTTFVVRARDGEGRIETQVTVASGRVKVSPARSESGGSAPESAAVVLETPGHATRVAGIDGRPTTPGHRDLKYTGAFRRGGFAILDASIPRILRELEYQFGAEIRLRVPASSTDSMSLHYARDAKLENVLRDICLTQNLSYRKTSQGYELVRK